MPAGRPTKRTPETEKRILDALRIGATRKDAALAAGISEPTFHAWMGAFPEFSESVEKAESEDKLRMLAVITKASQEGNWQAAAWRLERKDPDNFGRKERRQVEVSGPGGQPIQSQVVLPDMKKMTVEELMLYQKMTEKANAGVSSS